ncbi:hypothetical protein NtB2_01210 [Lactococcus termiticola]|uniref:DUF1934 domain-containing protein n=2 Tax=Lactococcus termiticola TaxID=2169526 RepID=A0A2R5HG81_9LACT|nr:hypothetical protein NtB2_01210 [Lactococcus termiticola]
MLDSKEEELIHNEFDGTFKKLSQGSALNYVNEEGEKVLLKFDESGLSMSRYTAEGALVMRFNRDLETQMKFPGLGPLELLTDQYHLDEARGLLSVHYRLAQKGQAFSSYQLNIHWGEQNV